VNLAFTCAQKSSVTQQIGSVVGMPIGGARLSLHSDVSLCDNPRAARTAIDEGGVRYTQLCCFLVLDFLLASELVLCVCVCVWEGGRGGSRCVRGERYVGLIYCC
jgi:hypothetical protein